MRRHTAISLAGTIVCLAGAIGSLYYFTYRPEAYQIEHNLKLGYGLFAVLALLAIIFLLLLSDSRDEVGPEEDAGLDLFADKSK